MKCCNSISCKNKLNSNYMKWLLELIAPVLMGSKCSEIINLPAHDKDKSNKLQEIESFFNDCIIVDIYTIDKKNNGTKVLIVNKNSLNTQLQNKKVYNFLKFLGYPNEYHLESYLNILISKLYSMDFPHEIGIFLGYPLKDVVGFMGYGNYPFYKTNAWRIYGNPTPSLEMQSRFSSNKAFIKSLISESKINSAYDLISYIS